jgi:hypothetical protein
VNAAIANESEENIQLPTSCKGILSECVHCGEFHVNLREHILTKHVNSNKMCLSEHCQKFFNTSAERTKHMNEEHKKWNCIYCDAYVCSNRVTLLRHIKAMHEKNVIQCNFSDWCAEYFLSEAEKLEHVANTHRLNNADEIECEMCKEIILRPHRNIHMRQFHNQSYIRKATLESSCCYCQKEFPSKMSVVKHVKDVHIDIETFRCYSCDSFFATKELKQEHYQKIHRGEFRCVYCANWKCTNISNLSRHYRGRHRGEVFRCSYNNMCVLYFKTQDDLQKHIRESHEADTSNKMRCIYCSKLVPRYGLNTHVKTQHKTASIKCNYLRNCLSYFLTEKDRQEHILEVHQPASEGVTCPFCSKIYDKVIELRKHAYKKHSRAVEKCSYTRCKFICKDLDTLEKHIKKNHSDCMNFVKFDCPKCSFIGDTLKVMQCHKLRTHGTGNLKCHHCPLKSFESKLSLIAHMRYYHSNRTTCAHCKTRIAAASWKRHLVKLNCEHCNGVCYCKISHAMHERECFRQKLTCNK